MENSEQDVLTIGKYRFSSRLFIGSGKFSSSDVMCRAVKASGTELGEKSQI